MSLYKEREEINIVHSVVYMTLIAESGKGDSVICSSSFLQILMT